MTDIEKSASTSILCALLADVASALRGAQDSVWALPDAPVLTADDGDLDKRIDTVLRRLGLCATVMLSSASGAKPALPGPIFDAAELVVEVCEASALNRGNSGTGVTALEAAEMAARALHQRRLGSGRLLYVTDIVPYPQPPAPADVCWHVRLRTGEVNLLSKKRII